MRRGQVEKAPFTKLSPELFYWPPWVAMTPLARCLWIGLYAGPQARAFAPGLWRGGLAVMAESSCLGITDAESALRELEERGVFRFDRALSVGIMTQLPDRGMRPMNGRCIVRYYNRWQELPDCTLTEAWVHLLLWLSQPLTRDHQEHWDRTFGDATDVSSNTKPVYPLFVSSNTKPELPFVRLSTNSHSSSSGLEAYKNENDPAREADSIGYLSDTPLLSSPSSGSEKGGSGGRPKGQKKPRKRRPEPTHAFAIRDLLFALSDTCSGRVATEPWDVRMAKPLWAVIEACEEAGVGLLDIRLAGEWLAAGGMAYRDDLGIPWIAKTGELLNAVALARAWDKDGRPALATRKQQKVAKKTITAADCAARAAAYEAAGD